MELTLRDARGQRKYLTIEEGRRFLEAVAALPPPARLLCLLVAYTGCRISEALEITGAHVERGLVTFRTLKRRKVAFRHVPVPEFLSDALAALAPSDQGARLFPVHRTTAYRWIKRTMAHSGLAGRHACPKGLRHGFGIRAALAKTPPNMIQRWLGHASPVTTAIYLDATGEEERGFAAQSWRLLAR